MQEQKIKIQIAVGQGYKYYLLVFKLNADRKAVIGKIAGNTVTINLNPILDARGGSFKFDFYVKKLPILK